MSGCVRRCCYSTPSFSRVGWLRGTAQCVAAQPRLQQLRRCLCTPVLASKAREAKLSWVPAEHRREVAQILEQAERATTRWEVTFTNFHSPPVIADAVAALAREVADCVAVPWGGYSQAERCRLAMGREDVMLAARDDPSQLEGVAALDCKGNFMFDAATHRDFLGAILGTGVVREKVGDILVVGEAGAQILVEPDLVEHFEACLTQVRTVPVTTRAIALSELKVPAPRVQELTSVEASMRLDAVASAGFRCSRSKMGDLIKAGDVRVNWRPASKPSVEVKAGDVVSVAGKGRLEIRTVDLTKKQKFAVAMVRYV